MKNIPPRENQARRIGRRLLLALLAAVFLRGSIAPAQPLTSMPLPELVASSSLIVIGTVISTQAVAPENPYANFEAEVRVEQQLKGETPAMITVRYPGPTTDLPARGTAEVENLPQFSLQEGMRQVFLLEGGTPLQLANLRQGILPIEMEEQIRAALESNSLAVVLTSNETTVHPAQTFQVTVHLKNVGTQPLPLLLPQNLSDCCRVMCWSTAEQPPNPLMKCSRIRENPSMYIPTSLQPGDECTDTITLTVPPNADLTSGQQAMVAVWVYPMLPGSTQPFCYATPPLQITILPAR